MISGLRARRLVRRGIARPAAGPGGGREPVEVGERTRVVFGDVQKGVCC